LVSSANTLYQSQHNAITDHGHSQQQQPQDNKPYVTVIHMQQIADYFNFQLFIYLIYLA